ncbi:hypothetical protein B1H58_13500 [Pantoea alhagi]|uniref:Branched-chain amino acid transport n=1 Tax=Pantoea alhagi TaxID=1891675 RepID=A0A1W6B758_9GAMM|nr:AzlD family protein [Pantoea alhagi]ARJ42938.1 hypothetical protein B1H58_13500 [Pantoea alhagi]
MNTAALFTIAGMAIVTYLTRVLGYLMLRNRHLNLRARSVMESAPGCVMVSAIAPYMVSTNPAMVIAMLITVGCAIRLSMLPTLLISIASLGILQIVLG